MRSFKVRKGLDVKLKIQQMYHTYFYIWASTGIVFSLIDVFIFLDVINSESTTSPFVLIGVILLTGVVFYLLKIYFIKLSTDKKLGKGKYDVTISNSDIFELIRNNNK